MPPKANVKGAKKAGLLAQHKKDVRQQAQQGKKELEVNEITPALINETTQITILKVWAKKLGVPDLLSYKVANIGSLKKAMLAKVAELSAAEEPIIDVREGDDLLGDEVESDGELMKQYSAIERFLKSYAKNPNKTTSIYGSAGDKFNDLWKELSRSDKAVFIQDYFQLNVELKKINPVAYLSAYIESRKGMDAETPESVTAAYLREFIKNVANPKPETEEKLAKLTEHALFPKTFLTKFAALEQPVQLKFAGQYVRSGGYRNPLDALELFLNPPKVEERQRIPIQMLKVGGIVTKYATEAGEADATKKNHYQKCFQNLRRYNWIIRPVSNVDEAYISTPVSAEEDNEWYHPSEAFYTDVCQYHSYVRSPREALLIINSNRRVVVEVRSTSNPSYSPSDLAKDLEIAQTGNIFVKLTPLWVLNTPLYQVDDVYLESPTKNLLVKTGINFDPIITALQKESQYETYQTYLLRFLVMFFPFLPNVVTTRGIYFANSSSDINISSFPVHAFSIKDKVKSGYITQDAYKSMALSEKAPEADISKLIANIERYLPVFCFETIKGTGGGYVFTTPIVFDPMTFRKIDCPEAETWYPKDLIVYKDKCLVIPELLTLFQTANYTDPRTGEELDADFVKTVTDRYSHLIAEKFQKKDFPVFIPQPSGETAIETAPGEIVYVDKALYDKAHPVIIRPVRKDKYTADDLSNDFDKYFQLKQIILDPLGLIENIMEFDIQGECAKCGGAVGDSGIKSMINRTDGTTTQISFCTYKCMVGHDFAPVQTTIDEEVEAPPAQPGDIVESV